MTRERAAVPFSWRERAGSVARTGIHSRRAIDRPKRWCRARLDGVDNFHPGREPETQPNTEYTNAGKLRHGFVTDQGRSTFEFFNVLLAN
jgi:hypothetical protein